MKRLISRNALSSFLLSVIPFLLLLHVPAYPAKLIPVPGAIPFGVELGRGASKTIRDWIKSGAKTRIKVNLEYSKDFGLPLEIDCKREKENKDEEGDLIPPYNDVDLLPKDAGKVEFPEEPPPKPPPTSSPDALERRKMVDARYAHTIFDWCSWEWSLNGKRGIWDTDFRFETYSLGLVLLADTQIDVKVDYHANATLYDREFFSSCVSLPRKLEDIARALKWALDGVVASEEEKEERAIDSEMPKPSVMPDWPDGHVMFNNSESICDRPPQSAHRISFGAGLKLNSHVCFRALRPENEKQNEYLKELNVSKGESYRLTDICICGSKRLQDSREIVAEYISSSFSAAISAFQILFIIFVVVNLPLIVLKLFPASEELQTYIHADVVPCEMEKAERIRKSRAESSRSVGRKSAGCSKYGNDSSVNGGSSSDDSDGESIEKVVVENNDVKKQNNVPLDTLSSNGSKKEDEKSLMLPVISKLETPITDATDDVPATNRSYSKERENNDLYTPLDAHTPSLNLLGIFIGKITCFNDKVNLVLSWVRRSVLFFLFSTHIIFFAAILDQSLHRDTIAKLLTFQDTHETRLLDLRFWNLLFNHQWDNAFGILFPFWLVYLIVLSHQSVTKSFIKRFQPSERFGVCDVSSLFPESYDHLDGLRKIESGMELRIGFFFRWAFWKIVFNSVRGEDKSACVKIKNALVNLAACLTFFPICAPLVPIVDAICNFLSDLWNKSWLEAAKKFASLLFIFFLCFLSGFLIYQNVKIYSMFLVYTLTSTIFHYQQSLNVIGVLAGSITFVVKILSQVKNKYIRLKMLTVEVARQVHEEKMATVGSDDNEIKMRFKTASIRSMPTLIWKSSCGLPYVPIKLYKKVVNEINPVGPERARIVIKLMIMTVFVIYIYTVMRALKMNEEDAAFDVAQAALTVVAVVIPSLLANLQSDVEKELETEQYKCIIERLIQDFLQENPKFYRVANDKAIH